MKQKYKYQNRNNMYNKEYKVKFLLTNVFVLTAIKHEDTKTAGLSRPGKAAVEKHILYIHFLATEPCNLKIMCSNILQPLVS